MDDPAALHPVVREGAPIDLEACVAIWVTACAARDGLAFDGVADRARPKFGNNIAWLIASRGQGVDGFVLATGPGSGMQTDSEDAAVVGLLAVAPRQQTRGLGRVLLQAVTDRLSNLGYKQAVLHALLDNTAAIRLYESEGWVAAGAEYEHSLLKRPARTFARPLRPARTWHGG